MAEEWRSHVESTMAQMSTLLQNVQQGQQNQQQQLHEALQQQAAHVPLPHDRNRREQRPERYQMGDPSIFIQHFRYVSISNEWTNRDMVRVFPTLLPESGITWHSSLPEEAKTDFETLAQNFIHRFQRGVDQYALHQRFHNLKLIGNNVEAYMDELQKVGHKLKKTQEETLAQFKLGLPPSIYRWVAEKNPGNLMEAFQVVKTGIDLFGVSRTREPNNRNYREENTRQYREGNTRPFREGNSRPYREDNGRSNDHHHQQRREEPMEFHTRGRGFNRQPRTQFQQKKTPRRH